jgi:hypothetical protein
MLFVIWVNLIDGLVLGLIGVRFVTAKLAIGDNAMEYCLTTPWVKVRVRLVGTEAQTI